VQRAFLSVQGTASSDCPALLVCHLLAPEVTQNNNNNNNNNDNNNMMMILLIIILITAIIVTIIYRHSSYTDMC
jgi:hypothetical protein